MLYKTIGDTLKKKYSGYEAWIISSNLEALKKVGLSASRKITLFNGPLECKLMRYELYEGTKKKHKM
jgi:putative N6-adenine-specific DNA methylase